MSALYDVLWWLGIPTSSSAVVCVRSTITGTVSIICNGDTFTANADTTVQDGIVKIAVTGLSANQSYSFSGSTPAQEFTGSLKTFHDTGKAKIVVSGCQHNFQYLSVSNLIMKQNPDAHINVGDLNYQASNAQGWGITTLAVITSLANATDISNRYNEYRLSFTNPNWRKMCETIPFSMSPDDHEGDINNCVWDLTEAQVIGGNAYLTSLDDLRAVVDAALTGFGAYAVGNTVTTGHDVGAIYHSFIIGNCEIFVLSCIFHGIDQTASDRLVRPIVGAANSMLGAIQKQWLKDGLKASTKPFKIICSNKSTSETGVQTDGWRGYINERDELLAYIHAGTDWAVPGGVVWAGSDAHQPIFVNMEAGVDGSAFDHVQMSSSSGMNGYGQTPYGISAMPSPDVYTRYSINDLGVHTIMPYQGVVMVESAEDDSYIDISLLGLTGNELCKARILAGENKRTDITGQEVSI